MKQPESILKLINRFRSLPGVGTKTAQRYAYAIIEMSKGEVDGFAEDLLRVKQTVRLCEKCGDFTEKEVCDICSSRDESVICVVSQPKDVVTMQRMGGYRGVYHVLHGTLSPIDGRGPEQLNIKSLLARLDGVKEVIMATNPDIEGEATAVYLSRLIKPMGIKVTRLAQGISMGSDIEYADEVTLSKAFEARTDI